jgi:hypothetical protein
MFMTATALAPAGSKVDLFILHRTPQPFDDDVVTPNALAVHADADAVFFEQAREGL